MAFVMTFLTDFKAFLLMQAVLEETQGDQLGNESAGEEQVEQIEQLLAMVGYKSLRSKLGTKNTSKALFLYISVQKELISLLQLYKVSKKHPCRQNARKETHYLVEAGDLKSPEMTM
jgi:hypothetical protein